MVGCSVNNDRRPMLGRAAARFWVLLGSLAASPALSSAFLGQAFSPYTTKVGDIVTVPSVPSKWYRITGGIGSESCLLEAVTTGARAESGEQILTAFCQELQPVKVNGADAHSESEQAVRSLLQHNWILAERGTDQSKTRKKPVLKTLPTVGQKAHEAQLEHRIAELFTVAQRYTPDVLLNR
ncbi:unnamed protein product [Amoebophrya sp. A25]|nr:unnamed protein product [Amoebophrya sp. A25]|eukprot:GSA25T00006193001.1